MAYHVYVSVSGEGRIARYRMNAESGALEPRGDTPAPGRPAPMAIDPARRFLYVARRDDLQIASYAIDGASGDLREIGSIPTPVDPAISPRTGAAAICSRPIISANGPPCMPSAATARSSIRR